MADYLHVLQHAAVGATCSLERCDSDWLFSFEDRLTLNVVCPWRIVTNSGIAVTDEDHIPLIGLKREGGATVATNALLSGKRLVAFSAEIRTADLRLIFEEDVQLQVTNNSSLHDCWRASFRYGEQSLTAIGTGGGDVDFRE